MHTHNKRLFICTYARRRPTIHLQRAYHYTIYTSAPAPHIMQVGEIFTYTTPVDAPHNIQVYAPHNTQGVLINSSASHNTTACTTTLAEHTARRYPHPRHSPRCCLRALPAPPAAAAATQSPNATITAGTLCAAGTLSLRIYSAPPHAPTLCPRHRPPRTPAAAVPGGGATTWRTERNAENGEHRAKNRGGPPPHAKYHALGPLPGFH